MKRRRREGAPPLLWFPPQHPLLSSPCQFHLLLANFTFSAFPGGNLEGAIGLFKVDAAKSLQSCPTLCDPIDGSPVGSAVPGILQARTLECPCPEPCVPLCPPAPSGCP